MPNIKVKYIIDENGDRVAPVTHIDAVRDSSGNGLSEILEDKPDATDLSAVATSGDYSDLENTPTSESAALDGTDLSLVTTGEKYIWNNKANNTVMVGATSSVAGSAGLVPAPAVADKDKFLKGDGTWSEAGSGGVDDLYTYTKVTGTAIVSRFSKSYTGGTSYYTIAYIPYLDTDVASKEIMFTKIRMSNQYNDSGASHSGTKGKYRNIVYKRQFNSVSILGSIYINDSVYVNNDTCYKNVNTEYYHKMDLSSLGGPVLTNCIAINILYNKSGSDGGYDFNPGTVTYEFIIATRK